MKLILTISLLIFAGIQAFALNSFSVTSERMNAVLKECQKEINIENMKSEIIHILKKKQKKMASNFINRVNVQLDGLNMDSINKIDLELIKSLTIHKDSTDWIWKNDYTSIQNKINGVIYIKRKCSTTTCKKRGLDFPTDLSRFNSIPNCSDALCSAQKIFGDVQGIKILWAYLKYGLNLSKFSDVNADPSGFDDETLNAILIAADMTPNHLKNIVLKNTYFYRFLKGYSLSIYGNNNNVIANAFGTVFDPIDQFNLAEKVYIFTHELGHRSENLNNKNLVESKSWKIATNWKLGLDKKYVNNWQNGLVSKYAKTSPGEDFAESYTLYRFDPNLLKQISPERYQFMKVQVFKNIEYDQNLCTGQINTN